MSEATIFLLLGYPGTGKLTIARELVHQLEASGREARLLDNHAAVQVLFSLTPAGDGRSPLPAALLDRMRDEVAPVRRTPTLRA